MVADQGECRERTRRVAGSIRSSRIRDNIDGPREPRRALRGSPFSDIGSSPLGNWLHCARRRATAQPAARGAPGAVRVQLWYVASRCSPARWPQVSVRRQVSPRPRATSSVAALADPLDLDASRRICDLSKGNTRKPGLARTFAPPAHRLVLDVPHADLKDAIFSVHTWRAGSGGAQRGCYSANHGCAGPPTLCGSCRSARRAGPLIWGRSLECRRKQ